MSNTRAAAERRLPFDGEVVSAERRLFEETVIFVHHFGGSRRSVRHHVRLVNELGFDAVIFNLAYHDGTGTPREMFLQSPPISGDLHFGARYIWRDQIEAVFNAVPGRKIVYAFSLPTNSAVLAIAHRRAEDISGLVGDGGPFLQLGPCMWNLYAERFKVQSALLRSIFTAGSLAFYGLGLERELTRLADDLPDGFPALSFRAGHDALVPEGAIDDFFDELSGVRAERITIDEAGHLEGFKANPSLYRESLQRWLTGIARRLG